MRAYLLKRVGTILPTLLFVSMLIFGLQQLLPGDPAKVLAGEDQDPTVIAYLTKKMHLDEPLPVRYVYWLGGVITKHYAGDDTNVRTLAGGILAAYAGISVEDLQHAAPGLDRMQAKGRELDKFEQEAQAFFERVRDAYLARARAEPTRFRVVDAVRPLPQVRADLQRIIDSL